MSAEQLWDSMIGLAVDSIDRRSDMSETRIGAFGKVNIYDYYEDLKGKSPRELYDQTAKSFKNRGMMNDNMTADTIKKKLKNAAKKKSKNQRKEAERAMKAMNKQIAEARRARQTEKMRMLMIKKTELASKLRSKSTNYMRASELRSPAPAKHILREFGQSDRETIENANTDPAVTQVLQLMNGFVDSKIGRDKNSVLTRNALYAQNANEAIEAIYMTMLTREPTSAELRIWRPDFQMDPKVAFTDLVWTLINSNEFIFVR